MCSRARVQQWRPSTAKRAKINVKKFLETSLETIAPHSYGSVPSVTRLLISRTVFISTVTSLVAQTVNHLSTMWETRVQSLGWEDPLEKEMAIHSNTIAWKIPWTEEPGRLQSMGSQTVGHDWVTSLSLSSQSQLLTYCDQISTLPCLWSYSYFYYDIPSLGLKVGKSGYVPGFVESIFVDPGGVYLTSWTSFSNASPRN